MRFVLRRKWIRLKSAEAGYDAIFKQDITIEIFNTTEFFFIYFKISICFFRSLVLLPLSAIHYYLCRFDIYTRFNCRFASCFRISNPPLPHLVRLIIVVGCTFDSRPLSFLLFNSQYVLVKYEHRSFSSFTVYFFLGNQMAHELYIHNSSRVCFLMSNLRHFIDRTHYNLIAILIKCAPYK